MRQLPLLEAAYLSLLQIEHNVIRVRLNDTYCLLRELISELSGSSSQEVQEKFELMAYNIKTNHSTDTEIDNPENWQIH